MPEERISNVKVKPSTGRFTFKSNYYAFNGVKKEVAIFLDVDYESEKFNIVGYGSGAFVFVSGNKVEAAKWKAIAECIQEAIAFGEKECKKEKQ